MNLYDKDVNKQEATASSNVSYKQRETKNTLAIAYWAQTLKRLDLWMKK